MKSNDICNGAVGHVFDSDMNLLGSGDVAINEDYEEALTYTNNDLNSDDVHHITVEQAGDSTRFKVLYTRMSSLEIQSAFSYCHAN